MLDALLDELAAFITAHPTRAFFNRPADSADIADIEISAGLLVPESYRKFLRRFNGGFINSSELQPGDDGWNELAARSSSTWLLGTADLLLPLERMRDVSDTGRVEYLPFAQVDGQDLLVFDSPRTGAEPAVLAKVQGTRNWRAVHPDFPAMLRGYLDGHGR